MKKIIADTNVYLRFVLGDNPKQKLAFKNLVQRAKKSEIIILVPQIVLFEIYFVLEKYYQFPKEKIIQILKPIITAPYLELQDKTSFNNAIQMFDENNKVSFVDCFLVSKAKTEEAEFFTFDKRLEKL